MPLIKSWNNLCIDFHVSASIAIFKKKIYALIRPETKTTCDIYYPEGLKFIFQLRVELSPLRYHKRRHNFIDTPSDICDCKLASETLSHFLFTCPTHQRIDQLPKYLVVTT